MKKIGLTMVFSFFAGALFAQEIGSEGASDVVVPYREATAADGNEIIFSNLDSMPDDRYNSNSTAALPVAGKDASGVTEEWTAVQFIPKADVRAKVLLAAIGYTDGAKRVKLGIFRNNRFTNSVGTLVPGGEGSTSQIPDLGTCCQLARVTLPGEGVALSANKKYWLVTSSDDVNAPTFHGGWHLSNQAASAALIPGYPWLLAHGEWPAAEIRGTKT